MNIKISRELSEWLEAKAINTIEFGTVGGSDQDLIHIMPPNMQMDGALHNRDHFLFYKDEESKVDHLFATPRCIVNGLITGSNTLAYELLIQGKFKDTCLDFLWSVYIDGGFYTSKLSTALLGVAERDAKQVTYENMDKKLKFIALYYNAALTMIPASKTTAKYCANPRLITKAEIRSLRAECIQALPKTISETTARFICADLKDLHTVDLSALGVYINSVYFDNWKESL